MPKYINSELGKQLSKFDSKTDSSKTRKQNQRYGILFKSVNDKYVFRVKILNKFGEIDFVTEPIPLIEPPHDLSARYGSPKDMENNYMVKITYNGSSINRGWGTIMKFINSPNPGQEYEETTSANELAIKGAAYAPPGAGMV